LLLRLFADRTGLAVLDQLPCLINTSFTIAREPTGCPLPTDSTTSPRRY
jgi:hypothetical protein